MGIKTNHHDDKPLSAWIQTALAKFRSETSKPWVCLRFGQQNVSWGIWGRRWTETARTLLQLFISLVTLNRFRVGVRFKGQIACLPCGVLLFSKLRMAICTACWVLVQRTSTDVHNWITFSVNPLVLAQSKTAHLYLMTSNPIWPNSDRAVLLPRPRWSNFKRVLCLAPVMWHIHASRPYFPPQRKYNRPAINLAITQ